MYLSTIYHALRFCGSQAKTLFLFTKSDIKTTIFPVVSTSSLSHPNISLTHRELAQSFFAVASAPLASITRLPHVIFWIWLHLLMFNLSNQTQDPDEDMRNKPDRPLPSHRITYANAIILRWLMVPVCWLVSLAYSTSVLQASVALSIFTFIYNELHGHSGHFVVKNVLNGTGFASFELGATLVAGKILSTPLRYMIIDSILIYQVATPRASIAPPFWLYASVLGYLRLPYRFRTSGMSRAID